MWEGGSVKAWLQCAESSKQAMSSSPSLLLSVSEPAGKSRGPDCEIALYHNAAWLITSTHKQLRMQSFLHALVVAFDNRGDHEHTDHVLMLTHETQAFAVLQTLTPVWMDKQSCANNLQCRKWEIMQL